MKQEFTVSALQRQRRRYRGSVGISQMNQGYGFRAAFRDAETGIIYGSCYADGRPAPVHLLDGLPVSLVLARAPRESHRGQEHRRRRLCPGQTLLHPR